MQKPNPTTTTTIPAQAGFYVAQWIGDEFKYTPIVAWLICTEEFEPTGSDFLLDIDRRDLQANSFPVTTFGWFDGLYEDSPRYIVEPENSFLGFNGAHIGDCNEAEDHARDWAAQIAKGEREFKANAAKQAKLAKQAKSAADIEALM
jgi:hypothetical protein